jgi:hypothetical protein
MASVLLLTSQRAGSLVSGSSAAMSSWGVAAGVCGTRKKRQFGRSAVAISSAPPRT